MGQTRPLFIYVRPFLKIALYKSVDSVLGIRTRDCRMVGTDESTELWWPSIVNNVYVVVLSIKMYL